MVYLLHFPPRLFLLAVFSGYDTKCALFEKASMVNCSQEFLVPEPKYWCNAWHITSICSSAIVILLVWIYRKRIEYSFSNTVRKLIRKASFWRMNFLLSIMFIEYVIACKTTDESHTILYAFSFTRMASTAFVIYCLNYVNPSRIAYESKMYYQVGYWLTLLMYFAECTAILLLYLLNTALVLAPFVDHSDGNYQALILVVFGLKCALSSQCLTFFFEKIFHGDKDLFSEPGDPVEVP